jgi:hypothetical protein
MTKAEFLDRVPHSIEHDTWGHGKLEIVVQKRNHKGVCYRHQSKLASYGTYGMSWKEVYDSLMPYLVEMGHSESS